MRGSELYNSLHEAIGARFEGYKGGSYEMFQATLVFCARWGETGRRIVAVEADGHDEPWRVVLQTEPDE